jgi:hypothetical protein
MKAALVGKRTNTRRSPSGYNRGMKRTLSIAIFLAFTLGAETGSLLHNHLESRSPVQVREIAKVQSSGTKHLTLDLADDMNFWRDSILER